MDLFVGSLIKNPRKKPMRYIRFWRNKIFVSLLIGVISFAVNADNTSTLKVGLLDFPPYYVQSADQPPSGELVELLSDIMSRLDRKWHARFYPTPRLLSHIVEGKLDLTMLIRHPLLSEKALYGQKPVGRLVLNAYHRASSPAVNDISELKRSRLILIRGYGYGGLIAQLMSIEGKGQRAFAIDHKWLNDIGRY